MTLQLGYCTNVHAGADLESTRKNLERYALAVKRRFSPDDRMGMGLWLSATAARQLKEQPAQGRWADWLNEHGLVPFTMNGFPHGDFHEPVVKHRVYFPTWMDQARLDYTLDLIDILHALLPSGMAGSISTLPLAWGKPALTLDQQEKCASALHRVAARLRQLEQEQGRLIQLCLEPEPGCALQRTGDVVRFFEDHVFRGHWEESARRYLCVCHDVCHSVVMFEEQQDVLARLRSAGIQIGKVQVSSAVCMRRSEGGGDAAIEQLAGFREPRYLHQTCVRSDPREQPIFYEDLPLALASSNARSGLSSNDEWRVHFHVPIYLERFGHLHASRGAIVECLNAVRRDDITTHLEVETYAWGVLPEELRQVDLAAGIADEMSWLRAMLSEMGM
jgi:hypothetical protein